MKSRIKIYLATINFIAISVLAGLMGIVFLPVLAHTMATVDFSSFSKELLYAQMISTPSIFGISAYLTTMVDKIGLKTEEIARAFSDWILMLAILTMLIIFCGRMIGFSWSLLFLLLVSYARAFQSVAAQCCRLLRSPIGFGLHQIAIPGSFYLAAVICSEFIGLSGELVFYTASGVYLLAAFYTWCKLKNLAWIGQIYFNKIRSISFVRFALGAFLHSLAGLAVTSWDKVYSASVLSPEDFGAYIVAAQYAGGLVLIFTAISQAIVPQMYLILAKNERADGAIRNFFLLMTSGFILLFALFEVAVGPLIQLVFPTHLYTAIPIAKALGFAGLLQGLYFLSSAVLFYYHRTFSLALITLICGSVGIIYAMVLNVSGVFDIINIVIVVWVAFLVFTSIYSIYLLKNV